MKAKKFIPVLSSLLILGLAGCSNSDSTTSESESASSSASSSVDDGTFTHSEVTKDSTIADIITWCAAQSGITTDNTYLYRVTGIMEGWDDTKDTYGDWYLTSTDGTQSIRVYGSTNQTSGQTAFKRTNGVITWTNPRNAKTALANYHDGDVVTMIVQRLRYNSTYEIQGYIVDGAVSKTTLKVAASAATATNGTVSLDKTSGITYGDTITVTATPNEGYVVESVSVKTAYGTINATKVANETNKYTFAAKTKNEVTVTFAAPTNGVEIDMTKELTLTNESYTTNGITLSNFENFTYDSTYSDYVLAKNVESSSFIISFASATRITFYQFGGKFNNFGIKKGSSSGEAVTGFTNLTSSTKFSTNNCYSTSINVPSGATSLYVYNNASRTDGKLGYAITIYGIVVE